MENVIESLTSTTCIIIYIVFIICVILCLIIKKIENTKDIRKQRHNTKELKNLVKEIEKEETITYEYNDKPVLEHVNNDIISNIAPSKEQINKENSVVRETSAVEMMMQNTVKETKVEEIQEVKEQKKQEYENLKDMEFDEDEFVELEYTSIEPSKEEAKRELEEITQKLKMEEQQKKEEKEQETPVIEEVKNQIQEDIKNIELTEFEKQQEKDSIISLEELSTKGKEMYESNEKTAYIEEKNEPISLKDLEQKMSRQLQILKDKFRIEKVADKPSQEEIDEMLEGTMPIETIKMDDMNTIRSSYTPTPVISPIYGIENKQIEIENTSEIKKIDEEENDSNEFIMSLKELQENLE